MSNHVKAYPLKKDIRNEIALNWDGESFDCEGTWSRKFGDWNIKSDSDGAALGAICKVTKRNGDEQFVILTLWVATEGHDGGAHFYEAMSLDKAVEIANR